ncbi:uncharacterized protein LOC119100099 [Pollicipes pollicipes]|uniref:uncharacterized protein LOC119100099 n=1 Tax=Pollicipes pollicipes TaxID=41117 RepID=UPI0018853ABE|nr:uncharacterized protein LOC119100099 [Pollicipes pollicipes]
MEDEIQAGEDGLYCVGFKNVYALTRDEILEALSQYGRTRSVRGSCDGLKRSWTFVRFSNPEEAVRAITGLRSSPHLCDVNYVKYVQDRLPPASQAGVSPLVRAEPVPELSPVRPPAPAAAPPTGTRHGHHEVFIGNWPHDLERDDVFQLCAKYNVDAVDVRLYKKELKCYAFVVVSSAEDVRRAIELLDGGKVAGRQIVVKDSRNSLAKQEPAAQPQEQKPVPPRIPAAGDARP